ncbi:aldo/keto reductase [Streptomyces sp. NBC_01754]|uniref:aldo/keto reductase n=1 Tax=Streptomyces sp. NBC_01754 TaxID=2975930 RepID=UPI002DDA71C8|nr:aldo/keto reductase [Streptomyces sp. NBC_01754]WSC96351.1 aldo/keto reductase [Streptomyces sp. NBC_01754]
MPAVPDVILNNGVKIPQLGFGTFQIEPARTRETTLAALEAGYRHIDTAEMYGNEKEVGQAVRDSGLDRADVFVTSKLNNYAHAYDDALQAFDGTMEALDLEYLDLFLIHWPLPGKGDFTEPWKAMEEIYRSGRAKAVGVSNFQPPHVRRLLESGVVVPAVNQIEVHPYLTQDAVRSFGAEHGIATEAWSPIARGKVLGDPVIARIAERVGKSTAQVTLRWHLQRGDIVFPKSVTRKRIVENFDLFDFELTEADIGEISALNRDERTGPDPDRFNG